MSSKILGHPSSKNKIKIIHPEIFFIFFQKKKKKEKKIFWEKELLQKVKKVLIFSQKKVFLYLMKWNPLSPSLKIYISEGNFPSLKNKKSTLKKL